jgi:hypothetical protein
MTIELLRYIDAGNVGNTSMKYGAELVTLIDKEYLAICKSSYNWISILFIPTRAKSFRAGAISIVFVKVLNVNKFGIIVLTDLVTIEPSISPL